MRLAAQVTAKDGVLGFKFSKVPGKDLFGEIERPLLRFILSLTCPSSPSIENFQVAADNNLPYCKAKVRADVAQGGNSNKY